MIDQGRTFQSSLSSRAGAKEAAAKAPASKQSEKGLWNFLTWSFFISHIVAAQQMAASSAMAAEVATDDGAGIDAQPAEAPVAAAAADQGGFEAAEIQQIAAPQVQSIDPGGPTLVALADQAPMRVDAEALDDTAAHAAPRGQTTPADLAEKSSAPDGGQIIDISLPGQPLIQVLEPVTEVVGSVIPVVETVLDSLVPAVSGLVGEVVNTLDPILEPVLTPVVGLVGNAVEGLDPLLEQVVSPVAGLAGGVIELVEPVLDPIIMPTVAVLEEVLQSLDPVIDPVTGIAAGASALLGEAIEPVTALVGNVVEPLVPALNELTAPIGDVVGPLLAPLSVLGPVTAPLLGPIADGISLLDPFTGGGSDSSNGATPEPLSALLGLGAGGEPILIGPVGIAAGSLDLPALPVVGGLDELFSGSSYTDYNLALQGGAGAGAQPLAAGAAALDSLVSGIENIAVLQPDSGDAGSDAPAATSGLLGGGGLRGLEWIGL
jgi:hypothetical protein